MAHRQSLEQAHATTRRVSIRLPHRHVVDLDPDDPRIVELSRGTVGFAALDVDVQSAVEASEDLDIASAENVQGESEPEVDADVEFGGEIGELYGIPTPHDAGDTDPATAEHRDAFEGPWRGETCFESLQEHAVLMGPALEEEMVIVDDIEVEPRGHHGHHPQRRGCPIADKGSGGPGGL